MGPGVWAPVLRSLERPAPPAAQSWGEQTGRCAGSRGGRQRRAASPAPLWWQSNYGASAGVGGFGGDGVPPRPPILAGADGVLRWNLSTSPGTGGVSGPPIL